MILNTVFHRILWGLLAPLIFISVVSGSVSAGEERLEARFQAVLDELHEQYDFPGVTAAYVLPDGKTGVAATGLADVEKKTPMTSQSRMLAASIGKTFVAATALDLVHDGVLALDVPISKWLGEESWFERLPNHKSITLRHLLTHSSGLKNHVHMESFAKAYMDKWQDREVPFSKDQLVAFILDQEPLFDAGKGWYYTDTGYILVGLIIEEATGNTYYDEVTKRFLEPLGLTLTSPSNRLVLPGLATGYLAEDNDFKLPVRTVKKNGEMAWNPALEWTGGGLVSNSLDLAKWAHALYGGRAMDWPYLDLLLQSVQESPDDPDKRYGLGVGISKSESLGKVYGHGGWIMGYISSMRYYPEHDVAVVFQFNTDVGIFDGEMPLYLIAERRLAETLIKATE